MKTVQTKPVHTSFKKDLAKFLETYNDKLSAEEMLAEPRAKMDGLTNTIEGWINNATS